MADNVIKFPVTSIIDFTKEEIIRTLDEYKNVDTGILLIQSGEDITIFSTKYSVELVGALEVLKAKIISEILMPVDEEEGFGG